MLYILSWSILLKQGRWTNLRKLVSPVSKCKQGQIYVSDTADSDAGWLGVEFSEMRSNLKTAA